jgi:hypothetical protein
MQKEDLVPGQFVTIDMESVTLNGNILCFKDGRALVLVGGLQLEVDRNLLKDAEPAKIENLI